MAERIPDDALIIDMFKLFNIPFEKWSIAVRVAKALNRKGIYKWAHFEEFVERNKIVKLGKDLTFGGEYVGGIGAVGMQLLADVLDQSWPRWKCQHYFDSPELYRIWERDIVASVDEEPQPYAELLDALERIADALERIADKLDD